MTAEIIIDQLDLKPHPEGGYCKRTYTDAQQRFSSILFLLLKNNFSAFHRIRCKSLAIAAKPGFVWKVPFRRASNEPPQLETHPADLAAQRAGTVQGPRKGAPQPVRGAHCRAHGAG